MRYELLAVNIIATMVYALNIVILSRLLYGQKIKLDKVIAFIALFGFINGSVSYFVNLYNVDMFLVKSAVNFIFSVLLIKFIIGFDIKRSFILFGLYLLILFISEASALLVYRLLNFIDENGLTATFTDSTINTIIGNAIICACSFLILICIKLLKTYFKLPKNTKTIIVTLFLTSFIILANMWVFYINLKSYTNVIVFAVITIMMILHSVYIIFNINISYKLESQTIELEQQKFYNEALDKALDNLRRFKHGYNNNLNVLYAYAKLGQHEKLMKYFNEVMEMNNKLSDTTFLNIKNAGLYGIVSSKIKYAEDMGVSFKIFAVSEVQDIQNIRMAELYEVMGIFLDNSIEAASKSSGKAVELHISESEEYLNIIVQNNYERVPDIGKIFEKGYSTKGDSRGLGLWIVKDIIKGNKNVLNNTYLDGDMFCQELAIKKGG